MMPNLNNVFVEAGAKKLARQVLNGFIPKGATGISNNEITITGREYNRQSFAVNVVLNFYGSKSRGSVYTKDDLALAEVGFNVSGATYQKLITAMATKAGRGPGSTNPFSVSVGQVDPSATYHFELGLGFQAFSNDSGAPLSIFWEADFQVTDAVTGQGSMGYAWNGAVSGWPSPVGDKKVLKNVLLSGSSGYHSLFDQPTPNGTATKVPQQPVAEAYVKAIPAISLSTIWPAPASGLLNVQGDQASGVFDPIPGATTPFVPNSFGI